MPTQKTSQALARPDAADSLARPLTLLGGLSPQAFMSRHWHKRPLLVRQAIPDIQPPVSRAELFRLAADEGVESRLISRDGKGPRANWSLQQGPLPRRALPPLQQPGWTVLVQGLNLHVPAADELLSRFRFIPQARLDDLMVSWASDGGGVGPHFDSYDVFLIQVHGQRRWRIGRMDDARLRLNVPVKLIANFRAEQEWVLEPGDMLYLPPGWAHDGDAVGGDCMTCSVGFRSATRGELVRESLLRLADAVGDAMEDEAAVPGAGPAGVREGLRALYADPRQVATEHAGRIPAALCNFTERSVMQALREEGALARALGEYLSEPKPQVFFRAQDPAVFQLDAKTALAGGVHLDARSCMLYDDAHVYLNGESWCVAGSDALCLQRLADARALKASELRGTSTTLRKQLLQWLEDGWLQAGTFL